MYIETMNRSYFLWWNVKGLSSHINFLVNIHTGDDEEDPGPPGSSSQQSAQSEDDGSLVLLDHLHHEHQGERHGGEDEEEAAQGEDVGHDAGALLALDGELAAHLVVPLEVGVSVAIAGDQVVLSFLLLVWSHAVLNKKNIVSNQQYNFLRHHVLSMRFPSMWSLGKYK